MSGFDLIVVLLVVNIPVYLFFKRLLFSDWDEVFRALRFWLTPDVVSLFRGEHWDDMSAELKLGTWAMMSMITVYAEFTFIQYLNA